MKIIFYLFLKNWFKSKDFFYFYKDFNFIFKKLSIMYLASWWYKGLISLYYWKRWAAPYLFNEYDKDKIEQVIPKKRSIRTPFFSSRLLQLILDKNGEIYGFKFHFKGRFRRKQRKSSIWFSEGRLGYASKNVDLDFGMYTTNLRFSQCSVKLWLYKANHNFSSNYWLKIS